MLEEIKHLFTQLLKKERIPPIYVGIQKRQRRSAKRGSIMKFSEPITKYNKFN